eukprot:TRINITY_DN2665_c0_g1_i2.p1 TRINITY_DN2665_c0_g1~~TRINITY_DN2665_c0_g1_i2.p1  ORF type:complete len:159 (-),score=42.27 TRINITY_DN2665_c0_g1_i2:21-497(-)
MTMSRYSNSPVILTDYDEDAIQLLEGNLDLNYSENDTKKPLVSKLVWGDDASMSQFNEKHPSGFDFIIGSDIVYYTAAVRPLFVTADRLLSQKKTTKVEEGNVFILCNQSGRLAKNYQLFWDSAEELGFRVEEIELSSFLKEEEMPMEKTHLFLIFRK